MFDEHTLIFVASKIEISYKAKKAAMQLLSGDGNLLEILAPVILGKKDVSSNMSSMASGLFESFLSGKTGSQAGQTKGFTEETE